MKSFKTVGVWLFAVLLFFQTGVPAMAASPDLTTKFRVYQNSNQLKEFANKQEAIAYAKRWANSYVEEIGTRKWVFSQFPKYRVYEKSKPRQTYFTLEQAIAEAGKLTNASIRHIESGGWVWHNYPRYKLYQGTFTQESWEFATLDEAKQEAKRWANSNIIDMETNRWVWDNIPAEKKEEYRKRENTLKVYQGKYSTSDWEFAYMEDAVKEALRWEHSYIVRMSDNQKVFSNEHRFTVYQYNTKLKQFVGLDAAIAYAKRWDHARIQFDGQDIWNNYPYYVVYQHDNKLKDFNELDEAMDYALSLQQTVVKTIDGSTVWDNSTGLLYWAWNGSMTDNNVKEVVGRTHALDVNSPTWFSLLDASGNVEDKSSPALVKWLRDRDIDVHPLVHNQFNSDLTSAFLADEKAQQKFIRTIVDKSAELGVQGINLDFESLKASDRDKFTKFVKTFAEAAHAKNLVFSIDLPRGSIRWNHLTAFDHAELHKYVDYIMIMTYDQYYSGSDTPGSVAGMDWVAEGVEEFLSYGIPRDKLVMGIPFYIRQWKLDANGKLAGTQAIYSRTVGELLASVAYEKKWDERFGQYRIEYKKDGFTYVFWLEDDETVTARIEIAKKYSLAGIAAWRLGQEPDSFWDQLAAIK